MSGEMSRDWRRTKLCGAAALVIGVAAIVGCSSADEQRSAPDAGSSADSGERVTDTLEIARADVVAGAACSTAPRVLVAYPRDVSADSRLGVQVLFLAVLGDSVFYVLKWTQLPDGAGMGGAMGGLLMRAPLAGGTASVLAMIPGDVSVGSQRLFATDSDVFYLAGPTESDGDGAIMRVPTVGGTPELWVRAAGTVVGMIGDAENIVFVDAKGTSVASLRDGQVRRLTDSTADTIGLADGQVLLADYARGSVTSVALNGGTPHLVADEQTGPLLPMACGSSLCWVNAGDVVSGGSIVRLDADGGGVEAVANGFTLPHDMLFDGQDFFVSSGPGGLRLERISAAGSRTSIVDERPGIGDVTLSDSCLYWTSFEGIVSVAL